MSKKLYLGIDNGISGGIACVGEKLEFYPTPIKKVLKYTKKKGYINRLDVPKFIEILSDMVKGYDISEIIISIERPMVNPTRWNASVSALRCWEATLICLEELNLPYSIIDSKEWQKTTLPKGVKGSSELKEASLQVGNRLFPTYKDVKHPDRDALLIAEHLRMTYDR